jgi:hypothetical protein
MNHDHLTVEAFEQELKKVLLSLKNFQNRVSETARRYDELKRKHEESFSRQRIEVENERLSKAMAAKQRRTERENSTQVSFEAELKRLATDRRRLISDARKEHQRRVESVEAKYSATVDDLRERSVQQIEQIEIKLQVPVAESRKKVDGLIKDFRSEFDQGSAMEVSNFLESAKELKNTIVAASKFEIDRTQALSDQFKNYFERAIEDETTIKTTVGEIDGLVQSIPRTFNEHSSLHLPVKLQKGATSNLTFSSTGEARNQIKTLQGQLTAICANLASFDNLVSEERKKVSATVAVTAFGILLVIVLLMIAFGWVSFWEGK